MNAMLAAALQYAAHGWYLFPIAAGGKKPAIAGGQGFKDATADPEQLSAWWQAHPVWNVGIACGESGLLIMDIDPRHGGDESLLDLRQEHGDSWMETATALTPSGGAHYYFRADDLSELGCKVGLRPGIDIRAVGGYVVVPPSKRVDGEYCWAAGQSPDECFMQLVPDWLAALIIGSDPSDEGAAKSASLPPVIPEGTRNDSLASIAGTMRRRGMTSEELLPSLLAVNERCAIPLPASEVTRIAKSIGRYAPAPHVLLGRFKLTDIGNAERLVAQYGADIRYCRPLGKWLVWDGTRWTPDHMGQVEQMAKNTIRAIYEEAGREEDDERRKAVSKHAQRSEGDRAVKAMLSRAESEPAIAATPMDFDRDLWLFNCLNGTIDLKTGGLREHRREDLITKLAPVRFGPGARLPAWDEFIGHATGGDVELAAFLKRFFGYSLTGLVSEEKFVLVHGRGGTGKSTFIEALKATFGDYAATADFETFLARKATGGPRPDIARLAGARLVTSIEVDDGKKLAQGLVKQITGGDTVTARELYAKEFEFLPQFKLALVANHAPQLPSDDDGLWRRFLRVPFDNATPEAEQDPNLKLALRNPALAGPAILAWLVEGCLAWQRDGLGVPVTIQDATAEYRAEMDHVAEYFDTLLDFEEGLEDTAGEIYRIYKTWCDSNGIADPVSIQNMGERLRQRGCKSGRRHGGVRIWKGVAAPGSLSRRGALPPGDKGDGDDTAIPKVPFKQSLKGTFRNPPSPQSPLSPEPCDLPVRQFESHPAAGQVCPRCKDRPAPEGGRCSQCDEVES